MKILIIEDEEELAKSIAEYLPEEIIISAKTAVAGVDIITNTLSNNIDFRMDHTVNKKNYFAFLNKAVQNERSNPCPAYQVLRFSAWRKRKRNCYENGGSMFCV